MGAKLTPKQKGFVKDFLETGNGTQAALKNYDIQAKDPEKSASVIASENLGKLSIVEAIRKGTKDVQIDEAFSKLINLKRLDYFVFSKQLSDEEITEHVEAQGIEVLNIRPTEKGKMAFFAIPDGQALSRALDFWAKVSGANAPEKHQSLNVNVDLSTDDTAVDLDKLVKEAEARLKEQKTNG